MRSSNPNLYNVSKIDMFTNLIEFEGVSIKVNGFNERKNITNVMPIFYEEQPITWLLFKKYIFKKFNTLPVKILDVGCGSGFWSILLKKKLNNSKVWAIDKNKIALEYAKTNAEVNKVKITSVNSYYSLDNFNNNFFDLIILTPPYHIYPPKIENKIPFFARGGFNGQFEFKNQLNIASCHLKESGTILFNMMCLGNNAGPAYISYIPSLMGNNVLLEYVNILPPIKSFKFLSELYDNITKDRLLVKMIKENPLLYYTSGIIEKRTINKVKAKNIEYNINRSWRDRILLHKEVNKF